MPRLIPENLIPCQAGTATIHRVRLRELLWIMNTILRINVGDGKKRRKKIALARSKTVMAKKTEPDVKIEDQEFFRDYLKRRDGFIATAKTVLGEVGIDQLWEMYGDVCVTNEDYFYELDDCVEKFRSIELGIAALEGNLKSYDADTKLAMMNMLAESKNLIAQSFVMGGEIRKEVAARKGGIGKRNKDPKQVAFREIRETHWPKWCHKKRYKAPFAREMIKLFPILESPKVIEDKCREWEKEAAKKV